MDPQQELFSAVLMALKEKYEDTGVGVYDTDLPPEDTPYPFIFIADNQQVDAPNKTAVFGNVYQTIHVWHNNPKQRGMVSEMLLNIKQVCYSLKHTANFAWNVRNIEQRILSDTTTTQPLLHGILNVEFYFD